MTAGEHNDLKVTGSHLSLGGALIALLALGLGRLLLAAPPRAAPAACAGLPPFVVSLPAELPPPLAPGATPAVGDAALTPTATAGATAAASASPTAAPSATPAAAVPWRTLLRADDSPAADAVQITSGAAIPLLPPRPCTVDESVRRATGPCVKLLPPASRLCAGGIVGRGRLSAAPDAPAFAFEAGRVTVSDLDGAFRVDALEGFFRYDDPAQGLALFCPRVPLLQSVGPNARQFIALCRNFGQEGWAVSGQATDGAGAAPDSISLTIDGPDGSMRQLVGSLANGAIVVRDVPDTAR
ncbi:MAG TPA: hypothetical protein VKV26_12350 [Dehalococcoidia bacterium]|nr:hypothetical protein [Dehalococcoidia bacterium]